MDELTSVESGDDQRAQAAEEIDRSPLIGVFLSGESFFRAAQHLRKALEAQELRLRFDMPVYHLYYHALELTMKAFLRTRGFSAKCLRSPEFGHKLQVLWEACVAQGLHSSVAKDAVIAEVIGLLDPYATEFEFRYLKVGYKKLPGLGVVERAAADLTAAVRPHCHPT
jgi:hypothetical protein